MEYFLAFYVAGIALAMYRLYIPIYRTIKRLEPGNIFIQRKYLGFFIILGMFSVVLILIAPTLLSDNLSKRFCVSFVDAVLNGV
jgi:hypothetical protein